MNNFIPKIGMMICGQYRFGFGTFNSICFYIVKNGKRVYPTRAKYFKFWVED